MADTTQFLDAAVVIVVAGAALVQVGDIIARRTKSSSLHLMCLRLIHRGRQGAENGR